MKNKFVIEVESVTPVTEKKYTVTEIEDALIEAEIDHETLAQALTILQFGNFNNKRG